MIVLLHLTPTRPRLMMAHHLTSNSHITMVMCIHMYIVIIAHELSGTPCDANGNYIDPSTPSPPHRQTDDPNDWTPYGSQLKFKTAEFLF